MKVPISFKTTIIISSAISLFAGISICLGSIHVVRDLAKTKDFVLFDYAENLSNAEKLRNNVERTVAAGRSYLLTGDPLFLVKLKRTRENVNRLWLLLSKSNPNLNELGHIEKIKVALHSHQLALERLFVLRGRTRDLLYLSRVFEQSAIPKRAALDVALNNYIHVEEEILDHGKQASKQDMRKSILFILLLGAGALGLATILTAALSRTMLRLYEKARLATQLRDNMIAVVSHDLKNPIASIQLNALMLEKFIGKENPKTSNLIMRIQRSTARMTSLITGLLDLAKLDAGHTVLDEKTCEVSGLLAEAVEELVPIANEKKIEFVVHQQDGMCVTCDRQKSLQILSNLLGNAIKFTPEGGRIDISVFDKLNVLEFEVEDKGPGIPLEQVPFIFDRFWQARNTAKMGTGLGLSIAKGFVEAQGGKIWVESRIGQGSSFHFTLPQAGAL